MDNKENNIFLPHLYEPFRREIAVSYVQQEMRKLFPQLRDNSLWYLMDKQIAGWYEDLSIRNFWNAVHGISMGFRLKSLVPWITSLNMQWREIDLPVEKLWFGGRFGPLPSLGMKVSEEVSAVKNALLQPENKEIFDQTKKDMKEKYQETAPRDDFPVFVIRKEEKLRVIDGNRRVLKAILEDKKTIRATIGEPIAEPAIYEHWVPTSLLVDLVFWHKRQIQMSRQTTETIAQTIFELIRDSSAGRIEFFQRAIHHEDEIDAHLLESVEKILKNHGMHFEIPK